MPLYDYLCRDCEKQSEHLIRGESDLPECPECGSEKLVRLLSAAVAHSPGKSIDRPPAGGGCGSGCGCFPQG